MDRLSCFKDGYVCELSQLYRLSQDHLKDFAIELFPEGLSQHGHHYLVSSNLDTPSKQNSHAEIFFEWIRRARFPSRPSRYQSMFAVDDLDSALQFRSNFGSIDHAIYELSSPSAFKADMRLITFPRQTPILSSYLAELYWQGLPWHEGEPIWEWIVPCPVTIGGRIM
ncbi:DUF2441 domain-containing protein [Pseudomonas shirazensis]|uniref:DUF2441 domain-containing protein n=1 Tax=Pseudomonas shirazensis TaxID=2745494 RepID=UPI003D26B2E0